MNRTADQIERIVVNRDLISTSQISTILNTITDKQLFDITCLFLQGNQNHSEHDNLSIAKLVSLRTYYSNSQHYTSKQRWMLFQLLIQNWQHLGLSMRYQMDL